MRGRVDGIAVESRGTQQNRDDSVVFRMMQRYGRFSYTFPLGRDEPVLWAADIVASAAYRGYARGEQWMPDSLGTLEIHELDID